MSRVVSFGSVNVDRIVPTSDLPLDGGEWLPSPDETVRVDAVPEAVADAVEATHLGGKGANAAVAAARAGAETTLVGMVGADAGDHGVRDRLEERGVDARLETVDAPTGAAYVLVDPDGGNRIALLPGANGAVDPAFARERAPLAREADVLLLQNEVPRTANVELLDALDGAAGPTVVFDPAPAAGAGEPPSKRNRVRPPIASRCFKSAPTSKCRAIRPSRSTWRSTCRAATSSSCMSKTTPRLRIRRIRTFSR
jgi:ribokinase